MAKAKNYNNYVEVVGNVATIYQTPNDKNGNLRFTLANYRRFKTKEGEEKSKTEYFNILVAPNRRYAKQDVVTKGSFLRISGHLENNSYKTEDGTWKGGMEVSADKITVLKARGDGKVENTETGEVETIEAENEE